jgi:hypothetical protein
MRDKDTMRDGKVKAYHQSQIAHYYLRGWTMADIGAQIGISKSQVIRDLKTLHKLWMDSGLMDLNAQKLVQLAKLDKLEYELWEAWDRSTRERETTTAEHIEESGKLGLRDTAKGLAYGERDKTSIKKEQLCGDPRIADVILKCIERRCKLLGLDVTGEEAADTRPVQTRYMIIERPAGGLSTAKPDLDTPALPANITEVQD